MSKNFMKKSQYSLLKNVMTKKMKKFIVQYVERFHEKSVQYVEKCHEKNNEKKSQYSMLKHFMKKKIMVQYVEKKSDRGSIPRRGVFIALRTMSKKSQNSISNKIMKKSQHSISKMLLKKYSIVSAQYRKKSGKSWYGMLQKS